MKINPDDPCEKMTIRLKLMESAMKARIRNFAGMAIEADPKETADEAFCHADALIKRANREEGKCDDTQV